VTVEKVCDELTGGVKVQSNWEIARSLRNNFRVSLRWQALGVELLDDFGGLPDYPGQPNSEYRCPRPGR
jgi:hypothetical protein